MSDLDRGAVAASLEALATASVLVGGAARERGTLAPEATAQWRGPARDAFDDEVSALAEEAAVLLLAIGTAERAIGEAVAALRRQRDLLALDEALARRVRGS